MDFAGKVIVITGASSGIGKETALVFAKDKPQLVLIARNKKKLAEAQKECEEKGAQVLLLECDVSDYSRVKKTCKKIVKKFGNIDILINNAGFGVYHPFREQGIKELEDLIKTNYFGVVYFTKELLPAMQPGSHIVNVSSMAGKIAFPNYSAYCASKWAVSGFTESLYHELLREEEGIYVHLVCPTGTQTNFFNNPSFDGHPHRIHYDKMMPALQVAKLIADSIRGNKYEVIPTLKEKVILLLRANTPWLYHRIMQSNYARRQIEKEQET